MPKLRAPTKRLDTSTELMHFAHAHRMALGWLVAKEAGIEPPISPLGDQVMRKWDQARNLPTMLKVYQPQAKLLYRIRALCLQMHDHPSSEICGGAESWWQRILEEDILAAICDRYAGEVMPELSSVAPPSIAATVWWLRRGINPTNPLKRPATWALIEAVQARVYPERSETLRPCEEVPLPVTALNGAMSLIQRKNLLRDLTGSAEGWSLNSRIELASDWQQLLKAWQLTAKEKKTKPQSQQIPVDQIQMYDALAPIIHNAFLPTWWANLEAIRRTLDNTLENKPSHTNGFGGVSEMQLNTLPDNQQLHRLTTSAENKADQSANPIDSVLANNTSRQQAVEESNPNPLPRSEP